MLRLNDKLAVQFSRWLIKNRLAILLISLIVAAAGGYFAKKLKLDGDLTALLPEDTPSVHHLRQVLKKTGGGGDLMVCLESPKPEASRAFAAAVLPKIKKLPWVKSATFQRDVSFFDKHKLLYMDLTDLKEVHRRVVERVRYEKSKHSPLYVDLDDEEPPELDFSDIEQKYQKKGRRKRLLESDDGKYLFLVVYPKGSSSNVGYARRVAKELSDLIKHEHPEQFHPQLVATIGGTFRNHVYQFESIISDVQSSSAWVAIGLVILIAVYFRHPVALVLLGVPLAQSLLWTFGLAYVVIGRLNLITVFLIVVLMGLGIDFGIHLLARFQQERARRRDIESILTKTLLHAGRSSLVAALTTAAGFFTLYVTDFRGFSDFGVIAGLGLLMSAVAFLFVMPVLCVYAYQWRLMRPRELKGGDTKSVGKPLPYPRFIFGVCVVVVIAAVIFAPRVAFEWNMLNLRTRIEKRDVFNRKMRRVFRARRDPAAMLVPTAKEAKAIQTKLQEKIAADPSHSPILKVVSVFDLVPKQQKEKLEIIRDLRRRIDKEEKRIPADKRKKLDEIRPSLDVDAVTLANLPAQLTDSFYGNREVEGQLLFIYPRFEPLELHNALNFSNAAGKVLLKGQTYYAASQSLVNADMVRTLRSDGPLAVGLALFTTTLLLGFDFRSVRRTALALLPLFVGLLWMIGLMAVLRLKLNVFNMVVLPSVLGLGVDGGVHIFHRYREVGHERLSVVLRYTGGPVLVCLATTMIGFGGMLSADHPGLRSMGWLALLGLGCCLVSALVFLPSVLAVFKPATEKKQ